MKNICAFVLCCIKKGITYKCLTEEVPSTAGVPPSSVL